MKSVVDAAPRAVERIFGSAHEKKDSDGDDVFEEAIGTQEHLPEQLMAEKIDLGNDVESCKNVRGLESMEVVGNSDIGSEAEAFEEAIGEEGPLVSEEKFVQVVGGDTVDGASFVDVSKEEAAAGEAGTSEVSGLENDGKGESREGDENGVVDVVVGGGSEISKDGERVDDNSVVVTEESDNGGSSEVKLEHEELESGNSDEVEKGQSDSCQQQESNGHDDKKENITYVDTGPDVDNGDEVKDESPGINQEYQDHDLEAAKNTSVVLHVEQLPIENGALTSTLDSPGTDNNNQQVEELGNSLSNSNVADQDGVSVEPKNTSANVEVVDFFVKEKNIHVEQNDVSSQLATSLEKAGTDPGTGIPSAGDESLTDKDEEITAGISSNDADKVSINQDAGETLHEVFDNHALKEKPEKQESEVEKSMADTSDTVAHNDSPNKDVGQTMSELHGNRYVVEVSEKPEVRVEQSKQETVVEKDIEVDHVGHIASSSRKSASTTPPPARPAGLGRAAPLLDPAPRAVPQPRVNGAVSQSQAQVVDEPGNGEAEENDETREKLQMIRVKFLRLAHRLGQTPHNVVVAQVLYRLGLAEQLRGRNGGRVGAFSFDRASAMAEQLEAAGQEPLDFSCTIMVLGKTGVGKSATINSIFDEVKFNTDAFQVSTKKVQDVVGTVHGIKVRVIDTPGLLPSWSDQQQNEKILHSVKRFIKKTPPDIILYLDRLDMQSRDFGDMPLLRTITEIFGPSIWFNAIVVLTHAASAPPDGPNGTASSYDMFVSQRSHVVQQAIRQAAGDMRLMNPVSLVENHSACRTNRAGQRVLPNGQVWKPHLLLLSFASKILAEANALLKLQDTPPGKPFTSRSRAPPLPFLLSSLLQSRPQLKLPDEQFGDEGSGDDDIDDSSDSDDESEYDELPPFKRLTKAQLAKLTKAQKKAYFDELEYREKLFMKKQLKEEKRRRKMMKKMAEAAKDLPSEYTENIEEESGGPASVPVPMPDLALPASFDSDYPTHRYRYLDSSNQWLVRPVLETHGWDHDVGYEGINVERLFVVKDKIPLSFSGQVSKDKKETNVQMEIASSVKHGEGKATSLGFDMQTVGKDLACTLRGETRLSNFKHNKAAAGISATLMGDSVTAGVKLEDKLIINKQFRVVMTGGAMSGRGDVAYGGSLEATLRDKDYPLGRTLSTLSLSVMDWHGDLALGCNVQSQVPIGRYTNMIARANLNNRGSGQVSVRLNSSEQLQIALIALLPLLRKVLGYTQQLQFGQ
ncbi:AIG1-type guanine nucleotide-binding (G) domain [Dillenia turbinata]|uniref:AIG1-type guanine nucleotide-binding (G) domain n=1 Tax=Dillenia turbinata TaxID=194707 RepID=A0AAN8W6Z7_9MAGN